MPHLGWCGDGAPLLVLDRVVPRLFVDCWCAWRAGRRGRCSWRGGNGGKVWNTLSQTWGWEDWAAKFWHGVQHPPLPPHWAVSAHDPSGLVWGWVPFPCGVPRCLASRATRAMEQARRQRWNGLEYARSSLGLGRLPLLRFGIGFSSPSATPWGWKGVHSHFLGWCWKNWPFRFVFGNDILYLFVGC